MAHPDTRVSNMKVIIEEYGGTIIAAVVAMLILGILLVFPVGGQRGLLGAVGASLEIGGDMSPGMSEADLVAQHNRVNYTVDQKSDFLAVGTSTPLSSIFTSTDSTAIFAVSWAQDNNGQDAIENGELTYDRRTHSITANKRGIYSIQMRASGKRLISKTFVFTAL